jgi:hypothetical protein
MEEKELGIEQKENTTQEQPKKKGGKNSKKKDTTEEAMVTEETMVTETPKDEAPVTTEEPKDDAPVVTEDSTASDKKQCTGRKPVPTIQQLRKMRKFNEGVFTFTDGFACVASSQRVADRMHREWLEGK